MKRFLYYLVWTIAIGFIVYLGAKFQLWLSQEAEVTYNLFPFYLFSLIFPIVIGMMLRLPKLVNEIRQNKKWTFDWAKFIAIGLPSLLILSMYVLLFYLPDSMQLFIPIAIFLGSPFIQIIPGVVFGYILLDSVKKNEVFK